MKIEEIENLMDKFYDLDSDVEDQIFEELLKFANNDKEGFINYVNAQKLDNDSYRPIIYQALMENAVGWEDFLLDQIKFIMEASESGGKDATDEISNIFYLVNIKDLAKSFYTAGIDYLEPKLNSRNIAVRKAALEYIVDLHFGGNITMKPKLKNELQTQLKDQIYTVRLSAYLNLKTGKLLPAGYKQSIIDKIRYLLSSDYRTYRKIKKMGEEIADQAMKNDL
ncbi:MAG: hypothetical protein AAFQ98_03920 [Bacteroidota bacterium]